MSRECFKPFHGAGERKPADTFSLKKILIFRKKKAVCYLTYRLLSVDFSFMSLLLLEKKRSLIFASTCRRLK